MKNFYTCISQYANFGAIRNLHSLHTMPKFKFGDVKKLTERPVGFFFPTCYLLKNHCAFQNEGNNSGILLNYTHFQTLDSKLKSISLEERHLE